MSLKSTWFLDTLCGVPAMGKMNNFEMVIPSVIMACRKNTGRRERLQQKCVPQSGPIFDDRQTIPLTDFEHRINFQHQ